MKLPDQRGLQWFLVGAVLGVAFFLVVQGPSFALAAVVLTVALIASIALALSFLSGVE